MTEEEGTGQLGSEEVAHLHNSLLSAPPPTWSWAPVASRQAGLPAGTATRETKKQRETDFPATQGPQGADPAVSSWIPLHLQR